MMDLVGNVDLADAVRDTLILVGAIITSAHCIANIAAFHDASGATTYTKVQVFRKVAREQPQKTDQTYRRIRLSRNMTTNRSRCYSCNSFLCRHRCRCCL